MKEVFVRGAFISLKSVKKKSKAGKIVFVVGQKVSKKATVRNRVKRRMRAAVRELGKDVSADRDIIVLVTPKILSMSFKEIEQEVGLLFKRAKIKT